MSWHSNKLMRPAALLGFMPALPRGCRSLWMRLTNNTQEGDMTKKTETDKEIVARIAAGIRQHLVMMKVENIQGVKCAEFRPERNGLIYIGGENEAGKSSFLDCLAMGLGGKKLLSQKPVREGARRGKIRIETDDYLIDWEVKGDRTIKFKVSGKNGKPGGKQALLTEVFGDKAFDPLEFSRMDAAEQRETMIALAPGLEAMLAKLKTEREAVFADRTEINREVARLKGSVATVEAMAAYESAMEAPDEPVSASEITAELREANEFNAARDERVRKMECNAELIEQCTSEIDRMRAKIKEIEGDIRVVEDSHTEAQRKAPGLVKAVGQAIDTEEIAARLDRITDTNEAVRFKLDYCAMADQLTEAQDKSDALTAGLEQIDDQNIEAVTAAKFPIEGIGFSDDGVTLDGHPFKQCSSAQSITTSFAIGAALNPTAGFMVIYEASIMDDAHLALLHELAVKADIQALGEWVTRSEADEERCAIVFEAGELKS